MSYDCLGCMKPSKCNLFNQTYWLHILQYRKAKESKICGLACFVNLILNNISFSIFLQGAKAFFKEMPCFSDLLRSSKAYILPLPLGGEIWHRSWTSRPHLSKFWLPNHQGRKIFDHMFLWKPTNLMNSFIYSNYKHAINSNSLLDQSFPTFLALWTSGGKGKGIVPCEWPASVCTCAAPFAQAANRHAHHLHESACLLLMQIGMCTGTCSLLLQPGSKWITAQWWAAGQGLGTLVLDYIKN